MQLPRWMGENSVGRMSDLMEGGGWSEGAGGRRRCRCRGTQRVHVELVRARRERLRSVFKSVVGRGRGVAPSIFCLNGLRCCQDSSRMGGCFSSARWAASSVARLAVASWSARGWARWLWIGICESKAPNLMIPFLV